MHLRELHARLLSEHLASVERLEAEVPTACLSAFQSVWRSCPTAQACRRSRTWSERTKKRTIWPRRRSCCERQPRGRCERPIQKDVRSSDGGGLLLLCLEVSAVFGSFCCVWKFPLALDAHSKFRRG